MYKEVELFEIIKIIRLAADSYGKMIGEEAKKLGITKGEADVLLFFSNNPNCINAKDAVFNEKISKAYVSKSISLLLDKNYITLSIDDKDKRYQKIVITDKAKIIAEKLNYIQQNFFKTLKCDIELNDFLKFFEVLKHIENNILEKEGNKNVKNI